jgi:hypothetical protein
MNAVAPAAEQLPQRRFAIDERPTAQIVANEPQQIERARDRLLPEAARVQPIEVRAPVLVLADHFR